jgi:hypothetical protein
VTSNRARLDRQCSETNSPAKNVQDSNTQHLDASKHTLLERQKSHLPLSFGLGSVESAHTSLEVEVGAIEVDSGFEVVVEAEAGLNCDADSEQNMHDKSEYQIILGTLNGRKRLLNFPVIQRCG